MAGPTYFLTYTLKLYRKSDKALIQSFGDFRYYLPHMDFDTRPSTGLLVIAGVITPLYTELMSWSPDISIPYIMAKQESPDPPESRTPNQNFISYFPNAVSIIPSSTVSYYDYNWVLVFSNGYALATGRGPGGDLYASESAYIRGERPLYTGDWTADIMTGDGSGPSRGTAYIVGYTELTDNKPTGFMEIELTGASSTTNNINYYGFNTTYGDNTSLLTLLFADAQPVEPPIPEDDDPYGKDPGGDSDEGGGEGDFDGDSDPIDIPPLPDLSAVDTGFISLFNPSVSQLQALANYMWSSGFDLETFKKLFADPMSCILGLSIVPVNVPSGGSSAVTVGNISTGVSMPKASRQYVEIDCGTLNVNEYWGAYLDYDPYTKAELYLPYIGTHPVAVDDIMKKAVHVVYHVDILSGACIAYVKCGDSVLYSFIGHCSSSIPITGNDWTNVINGVLGIAGAVGTMVATGGASAPYSMASIASTAVNSLKPTVEKSGALSGTGGIMGIQKPYLILTRPRQALPARQNKFIGYPSFITVNISDLSGYTEIESVHLEGIPATDDELSEIESILKSGVIF